MSQRPAAADQRSEPGHWEGDLINGKHNRTATEVNDLLSRLPPSLAKTLTWDQGREMAHWRKIEAATGVKVYFC